ncbi:Vacuolar protein sorting-associated protein 27-like protein [Drosera capensis]
MLEKIGLPAKPAMRGSNWVVDASHCQGCASQFTFINRKHHCRRCGGIFCNNCTQQRMVLRGQGDSPVRICDPCKKLEDAARFELRHGHKSKAGRGTSKAATIDEDEVLNQLLPNSESTTSKKDVHVGARSSSSVQQAATLDEEALKSVDEPNGALSEATSDTPEELRQQAVDEKNKYKVLKGKGNSAEAMKAFKRAKELERQAAALELQLRKNRRKASVSSSIAETQTEDHPQETERRSKPSTQKNKVKDNLASELIALGWSDKDLHDVEQKPGPTSVESELLSLIGETSKDPDLHRSAHSIDKTEVTELKRKAVSFKREGRLAEAKEELKKAKILEKQLEEQELLAGAEDSDDEISALIRSFDSGRQDDMSLAFDAGSGFDFDHLARIPDDPAIDVKLDVTDDDLDDPEIAAALNLLGWTDESSKPKASYAKESDASEVLDLKKKSVSENQSVNVAGKVPELNVMDLRSGKVIDSVAPKQGPKSRLMIQRELLALKKKARALRMEGKVNEAEEELSKCKVLEQQLEEMQNAANTKPAHANATPRVPETVTNVPDIVLAPIDEGDDDVTDQDLHDPAYLKLLSGLGWQEEDLGPANPAPELPKQSSVSLAEAIHPPASTVKEPRRSKAEVQRELLSLKRKARSLRSQGQVAEADELLEKAKALESEIAVLESSGSQSVAGYSEQTESKEPLPDSPKDDKHEMTQVVHPTTHEAEFSTTVSVQQEILGYKRKALALKREGKLADARDELRKAKLLEKTLEEENPDTLGSTTSSAVEGPSTSIASSSREEVGQPSVAPKPMSSQERFKLQRECLTHKRNALKLRREGRVEEAEAEQQLAVALESQLQEANDHLHKDSSSVDAGVEDLLDPQLLSALKAIGFDADGTTAPAPAPARAPAGPSFHDSKKSESSSQERIQLEVEIKAEKTKAVRLKQSGNKAEALDALRRAKQLEKKLISLPS